MSNINKDNCYKCLCCQESIVGSGFWRCTRKDKLIECIEHNGNCKYFELDNINFQ